MGEEEEVGESWQKMMVALDSCYKGEHGQVCVWRYHKGCVSTALVLSEKGQLTFWQCAHQVGTMSGGGVSWGEHSYLAFFPKE